ncbi:hypothetical protein GBAR_LOCUS18690 [Geodia barretti]|uniref:Uncharacterized protein n=1 Tax=Geodia barretti TaxID=519541 RepID=A0AA35SPX9_GEOBA|nr:hypothetical protein GBAR_LOCUS18690 [Geodia barretti]
MAGKHSEGMELFVSPKDIQRGRRRRAGRPHAGYQSEGAGAAAASEWHVTSSQTTNEELLDTHTYLSDHGLPSERARIAASNRYRELQQSGEQENFASTERTPLLSSQMKETVLGNTLEPGTPVLVRVEPAEEKMTDGVADSLAHEALVHHKTNDLRGGGGESLRDERKRLKREKYYRVGRFLRVAVLTSVLLVSMILFSINDEPVSMLQIVSAISNTTMSLKFPDSEDWEHAVLSLNGPFKDVSFRNGTQDNCEDFLCFCSPRIEEGMTCEETCSSDHCHSVRVLNFSLSDPPFFQSSDVINRDIQISHGDRGGSLNSDFSVVMTSRSRSPSGESSSVTVCRW